MTLRSSLVSMRGARMDATARVAIIPAPTDSARMVKAKRMNGNEWTKSRHMAISPAHAGPMSQTEGCGTSIRLATATTPWVLRARSPAHFRSSSVSVLPLRKTTPTSTRTRASVNQPVASRTLCRRRPISSSRATGVTSTVAGAAERSSLPALADRCIRGAGSAGSGAPWAATEQLSTQQAAPTVRHFDSMTASIPHGPAHARQERALANRSDHGSRTYRRSCWPQVASNLSHRPERHRRRQFLGRQWGLRLYGKAIMKETGDMKKYGRFAAMIFTSTVVMFGLMYLNTYEWSHVSFSETRTYMAMFMGAAMALVMLAFMLSMYTNRKLNIAIISVSAIVFVGALWLVRSQSTVKDVSWMRAMIPHHSIAILTSERARLTDPRVRKLADEIMEAQRSEIGEMQALIRELEKQ